MKECFKDVDDDSLRLNFRAFLQDHLLPHNPNLVVAAASEQSQQLRLKSESESLELIVADYQSQGLVRADRQDQVMQLSDGRDTDLMDRALAWSRFFEHTRQRFQISKPPVQKAFCPILTAFGGPGSGKSRLLEEIASKNRADFLVHDAGKVDEFHEAMRKAVGITISFNNNTGMARSPFDSIPSSAIGMRILYSYFIDSTGAMAGLAVMSGRIIAPVVLARGMIAHQWNRARGH